MATNGTEGGAMEEEGRPPAEDGEEREPGPHAGRLSASGEPGTEGAYPASILLADDDLDMRRMTGRTLRRAGYQVVEVADGGALLEHLGDKLLQGRNEEPDLIISDIRMPGCSGLDVLAGLRRGDWSMPVILITAFGDRETHAEASRLGATLLDKPFELDELLRAVRAILPPRF